LAARKSLGGAGLPPLADLFSTSEERALEAQTQERVMMLPVSELHDFPGHPFQVRDDEEMEKLAESITQHGVLMPGLVRPRAAGGYEIVAGHRRKFASMKAGIREMPVIVRDMDDDTAVILMVDSNVQRENVLPSEKARAYKMKLDAIKRKAGRPSKENSGQLDQNFFNPYSVEKIAQDAGESTKQVQRYIRLNELIPELLEMVDGNEIKFNPAYELAFLRPEEQAVLYDILQAEEVTPSLSQAQRLKRASQEGRLSEQDIAAIMREEKAQTRDTGKVTLPAKEIEQFFPKSYTPAQKKKVIVKLLASWARQRGEQVR
jgi:ParB family chromosome partitioning protein